MYNSNKFITQYVTVNTNTVLNYPAQLTNDTILTVNIPQDIARIPNVSLSVVSCCIASNEELGVVVLKTDNVASNYVGNDNQGCILSNLYFSGRAQGGGANDFFHYANVQSQMDLSYSNLNQLRVYLEYQNVADGATEKVGLDPAGASAITAEFSIVFKLCYENTEEINKQYREQINPHLV